MDHKLIGEIGRMERRLQDIAKRRSELVELIHPYQKEMDDLLEEAETLQKEQQKLIEKA
jgi:DNA repair ATPase RecN